MVPKLTLFIVPESHTVPDHARFYYEPNKMRFSDIKVKVPFLRKDIYEWMIENIGDEVHTMRVIDRIQYGDTSTFARMFDDDYKSKSKMDVSNGKKFEVANPLIDPARRTWRWDAKSLGIDFHTAGHDAVYKLAWF